MSRGHLKKRKGHGQTHRGRKEYGRLGTGEGSVRQGREGKGSFIIWQGSKPAAESSYQQRWPEGENSRHGTFQWWVCTVSCLPLAQEHLFLLLPQRDDRYPCHHHNGTEHHSQPHFLKGCVGLNQRDYFFLLLRLQMRERGMVLNVHLS